MAWRGLPWDDLMGERAYNAWPAYAAAKLANLSFTVGLARRLASTGVTANAMHPGIVRTELGQDRDLHGVMSLLMKPARLFFATPERGARTITFLASSPSVRESSGHYYVANRRRPMSSHAKSVANADRLWSVSEQLLGLG